ncbi:MAG TPA: hypothetical protein VKX33_12505 [Cyclobacteriaceae bacterium]|nr:hypothetical protein [Cyclobacteriaceae bacterium]
MDLNKDEWLTNFPLTITGRESGVYLIVKCAVPLYTKKILLKFADMLSIIDMKIFLAPMVMSFRDRA